MIRKIIASVLLLALLLTGCSLSQPTQPTETSEPPSEPSVLPPSSPEADPEPQEFYILAEETDPIFDISGTEAYCAVSSLFQDVSQHITTYSLETGAVLGEVILPGTGLSVAALEDYVALWNWDQHLLQVYTPQMELLWEDSFDTDCLMYLMSQEGIYILPDETSLFKVSFADQKKQTFSLPPEAHIRDIYGTRGQDVLLSGSDSKDNRCFYWLDPQNGSVEEAWFWEGQEPNSAHQFYSVLPLAQGSYLRAPDGQDAYFLPVRDLWQLQSDEGHALLAHDNTLYCCDLAALQVYVYTAEVPAVQGILCGNRVVYYDVEDRTKIYIWDTSLSEASLSLAHYTMDELQEKNSSLAASISERSGLQIFYGEEGTQYNLLEETGYLSQACTDPLLIAIGLDCLDRVVQQWPRDIFREMGRETQNGPVIYLPLDITANGPGTVSSALGFAQYTDQNQLVALGLKDVTSTTSFLGTIAHEFMHIMEQRIDRLGFDRELRYNDFWISFVEDPALYLYSYDDESSFYSNEYCVYSELPPEEILFLDGYSRTFPTEDRARILENLYIGSQSSYRDYLYQGILLEKAQYLCALLRECFQCCAETEGKLPWETLLPEIPSFDTYRDRVMAYEAPALG